MNETLSTIANRYSCRAYDGRLPEKEKLESIALAAVQSPSGLNRQPWKVVVVTNKDFIDDMDAAGLHALKEAEDKSTYERIMERGGKLFYNAPVMFIILKKEGRDMDCGIVSQSIALAATSLGLGNVICGMAAIPFSSNDGERFKQRVGITEGWEFGVGVLVGYPKVERKPHDPDTSKIYYVD